MMWVKQNVNVIYNADNVRSMLEIERAGLRPHLESGVRTINAITNFKL